MKGHGSVTIHNPTTTKNQVLSDHGIVNIIDVSRNDESNMANTGVFTNQSHDKGIIPDSEQNM